MSIITSKAILRGCFVRTVCLQNEDHNHNNYHLVNSAAQQDLCQDPDHFQGSQSPCPESDFVDEENETKESNSQVHTFCDALLPPSLPLESHWLLVKILHEVFF